LSASDRKIKLFWFLGLADVSAKPNVLNVRWLSLNETQLTYKRNFVYSFNSYCATKLMNPKGFLSFAGAIDPL